MIQRRHVGRALEIFLEDGLSSLVKVTGKSIRNWTAPRMNRQLESHFKAGWHRLQFGRSAPDRDELLYVDPTDITSILSPPFCKRVSVYATHVVGGEWDEDWGNGKLYLSNWRERDKFDGTVRIPVENFELLQSARQHFHEGVPWEDTPIYDWLIENRDDLWYTYESVEKIQETLADLDALYEKMNEVGYRTQRELQFRDAEPFSPTSKHPPELGEVMVNIGRDGQLIFDEGRHRWVVARLAGVDLIPVRVLVRHERWQRYRQEISRADSISELSGTTRQHLDHPDMQDL